MCVCVCVCVCVCAWPSLVVLVVKYLPANAGDIRDVGSIPGLGRWHGNPVQYSCLENPVDREAWWSTVHSVTQSQRQLQRLSMHACKHMCIYVNMYISNMCILFV